MKTWKYLQVIIVAGFLLTACSSPVYIQKDDSISMSNYHTYMWVDTRANQDDNSARATAYADISIRNAVNQKLNAEGWREVSSNPDLFISYDILVQRANEQRSDAVYSQPFTRVYYNPFRRSWGTIYYPSQFLGYQYYQVPVKEGTVTVTMMDANSDKIVWQGWTTENLNYSRITDDEISRSVRHIFRKFDANS